jgi:hypothetical protein
VTYNLGLGGTIDCNGGRWACEAFYQSIWSAVSTAEVREEARAHGWTTRSQRGGRVLDFCPKHVDEGDPVTATYARCSVCTRFPALRKDGTVRAHHPAARTSCLPGLRPTTPEPVVSTSDGTVRREPAGAVPWTAFRARFGHPAPTSTRVLIVGGRWEGRVGVAVGTAWIAAGGAQGGRQVCVVDLDPTARAAARRITCYPSSLQPEET